MFVTFRRAITNQWGHLTSSQPSHRLPLNLKNQSNSCYNKCRLSDRYYVALRTCRNCKRYMPKGSPMPSPTEVCMRFSAEPLPCSGEEKLGIAVETIGNLPI